MPTWLNRTAGNYGYSCSVFLSAAIMSYPGLLAPEQYVDAPYFSGFGLTCKLNINRYTQGGIVTGYGEPVWVIEDNNGTQVIQIQGLTAGFNLTVWPAARDELVTIELKQNQAGEYLWAGLPGANLPLTTMELDYGAAATFAGAVNGVPFATADPGWPISLGAGALSAPVYGDPPSPVTGGTFGAKCKWLGGPDFSESYKYTAAAVCYDYLGAPYDAIITMAAGGNYLELSGEHISLGRLAASGSAAPGINTSIGSWPAAYEYEIKERTGASLAGLSFEDANGLRWTGGQSPRQEYAGRQSVTAYGYFYQAGHTETADPAFDGANMWSINNPAPANAGEIVCTNPERLNPYTITITDPETQTETTYKPGRVLIYAPLGDSGNLEGSLSISQGAVTLDTFAQGWHAEGGGFSANVLVINAEPGGVYKTDFTRAPYSGERGNLTAAELVPHWPHGNLLTLTGSGFDPGAAYSLQISAAGGAQYNYYAQSISANAVVFDLTKPAGYRGADEGDKIMTATQPEKYTGDASGQAPDAPYYIDEDPLHFPLYGPATFKAVKISGFANGTYTLTALAVSTTEGTLYYHFAPEFCQAERVGRQHIAGQDAPIYRNRQGAVACSGRWYELPNNQKDVSPSGIERWTFPTVANVEGSAGDRLIFPRDDWRAVTIAATTRAQGGSPAPVTDAISEAAYLGWVFTDAGTAAAPKIKPAVDIIPLHHFYNSAFNSFKCVIDILGAYQGETGPGITVEADGIPAADEAQYMTQGQGEGLLLVKKNGQTIPARTKTISTPPGYLKRYALRLFQIHGKILRNLAGLILKNAAGKILRGDFEE